MPFTPGTEFRINNTVAGDQGEPEVIRLLSGNYLVTYNNGNGVIISQLFSSSGTEFNGEILHSGAATGFATSPLADGGFAVALAGPIFTSGDSDIGVIRYNAGGARVGNLLQAHAPAGQDAIPSVAGLQDGGLALAWEHTDPGATADNGGAKLLLELFTSGGASVGPITLAASFRGGGGAVSYFPRDPAVTQLSGGDIVVAWRVRGSGVHGSEDADVIFQRFTAQGVAQGQPVHLGVHTQAGYNVYSVDITATADGGFAIGWAQSEGHFTNPVSHLVVEKFAASGAPVGPAVKLAIGSVSADPIDLAATGDGGFILGYSAFDGGARDVFQQAFDANGVIVGERVLVNATTAGEQIQVDLATDMGDHGFLAAWRSGDGDGGGIYGRLFSETMSGGSSNGQVITSPGPGSTLQGGSGNDTLIASQGPDVLTGGGGGDAFVYRALPWNAGRITDFTLGSDRIDLSAIFQASGYTGSDPVADGRMRFDSDGAGGTRLFFDRDAPNGGDWPFLVTTLQNVSPTGLTWAQLSGGGAGPAPADTRPEITGIEQDFIVVRLQEKHVPNGTEPNASLATATGSFGISAPDGVDDLIVGGVSVISNGVFTPTSITTANFHSTLEIFGYNASTGRVDWRYRLNEAQDHSNTGGPGPRSVTELIQIQLTDADGDAAPSKGFSIQVADDTPRLAADTDTAQAGGPAATGNVLTDAAPGDAGDTDAGADRMSADGGQLVAADRSSASSGANRFPADGQLVLQGSQGPLTIRSTGDYSYVARTDAAAGAQDTFYYWVSDADAHSLLQTLQITIGGSSSGGDGRVITSPGPGSTLVGGSGADTLNASQGPDVLTGGGGGDVFAYADIPWSAGRITDFTIGTDRLDLSGIFQDVGYRGSDPVADGYVRLVNALNGTSTYLYVDRDGPGPAGPWENFSITLDNVYGGGAAGGPGTLSWAQLAGSGAPPPPPPSGGQFSIYQTVADKPEGDTGSTLFAFRVGRTDASVTATVTWAVTGSGANPASAGDFAGGAFPTGGTTLAAGEYFKDFVFNVAADTVIEADETFSVTLTSVTSGAIVKPTETGIIRNDDATPPADGGRVITSSREGDTLSGGAGADTLNAGQGPDRLTGGGSSDHFVYGKLPWNAGHITDFTPGADKLDLRPLFQAAGYSGSDPIGDGRLSFRSDGAGNTQVYFDRDAPNGGDWPFLITTLDGVTPNQVGNGDWLFY